MTNELTTQKMQIEIAGETQTVEITRKGEMSRATFDFNGQTFTVRYSERGMLSIDLKPIAFFYQQMPVLSANKTFRAAVKTLAAEMATKKQCAEAAQDAHWTAWHRVAVEANELEAARLAIHNA